MIPTLPENLVSTKSAREWMYEAITDELTGSYSRKALSYLKLDDVECLVTIVDLNGLKYTNDILGYDEGDRRIKVVANSLHAISQNTFRLGGDEFLIIYTHLKNDFDIFYKSLNRIRGITYGSFFKNKDISFSQAMSIANDQLRNAKRDRKHYENQMVCGFDFSKGEA